MANRSKRGPASDPVLGTIRLMQHKARLWSLRSSYLAVAVLVGALVFAGVLLDHLLVLQREGRTAFLVVFGIAGAGAVCAATLFPLLRRLGDLYVAREIERHVPELRNSLISYVQCRTDPRVPREVKQLLVQRVSGSLAALDPQLVAHPKRTLTLMWCALAVACLLGAYAAFSPKSVLVSAHRLFAPRAPILPPTATRIVGVQPGDAWVVQGTPVDVSARIEGARPQNACVVWSDSRVSGQKIFLSLEGVGRWTGRLPAALEDVAYHVEAGDTRSENFRITVLPKCVVLKVRTSLVPPPYTGLPPRTTEDGTIDAVWGTTATIEAHTSIAPRTGFMEFSTGQRIWMTPDPARNLLRGRFQVTESGSYAIRFRSVVYPDGSSFEDLSPVTYKVTCRKDEAPQVDILAPEDGLRAAPSAIVTLKCRARDDFGVGDLSLSYSVDGIRREAVELDGEVGKPLVEVTHRWDLSELSLRDGSVVSYRVQARDNWPQGPHVTSSETRQILIGPLQQPEEAGPAPELPQRPAGMPLEKEAAAAEGGSEQTAGGATGTPGDADAEQTADRIARALRNVQKEQGAEATPGSARPEEPAGPTGRAGEAGGETGKAPSAEAARESQRQSSGQSGAPERRQAEPTGGTPAPNEGARPGTPEAGEPQEGGSGCQCAGGSEGGQAGGASSAGSGQGSGGGDGEGEASRGAAAQGSPTGTPGQGGDNGEAAGETPGGAAAERGGAGAGAAGAQGADEATEGGQAPAARGGDAEARTGRPGSGQGGARFPAGPMGPVTGGGGPGGSPGAEREKALDQVGRMLREGRVPEGLLKEIGMNREQLRKFLESYRAQDRERAAEASEEPGETPAAGGPGHSGEVVESAGVAADDVRVKDVSPDRLEKDELRDLFEDASGRLTRRYRELVSAYYERLSSER